MKYFLNTVSIFKKNKFVNYYKALFRHMIWQIRKILNLFPCKIKLPGFNIIIHDRSIANGCGGLLNSMQYYDPNNMYLIEELFAKKTYNTFFDIGANIGVYSLIAAYQSDIKAFAFEPHPLTFRFLKENINTNNMNSRVTCHQLALSDSDGTMSFTDDPGSSVNRLVKDNELNDNVLTVETLTGDSFCKQHAVQPDVIKIDVEGFESNVLSGFTQHLPNVQLIFIETFKQGETTKILTENYNFMGPYKIDYKNRIFSSKFESYDDWVFINNTAITPLQKIGFYINQ